MAKGANRSAKLDLRLTPDVEAKLRSAARAANQSISEFVLESAMDRADETLAERTRFGLDAERWRAFVDALDAPPVPVSPRLGRLLKDPSVFESGRHF